MQYDYKCSKCGHEILHVSTIARRNDPLTWHCAECDADEFTFKRVYSVSVLGDGEMLKADKRMENSGVQGQLERIRDQCNPNMKWN